MAFHFRFNYLLLHLVFLSCNFESELYLRLSILLLLDLMQFFFIYVKLISSYLCCIWLFCHAILIVNQIWGYLIVSSFIHFLTYLKLIYIFCGWCIWMIFKLKLHHLMNEIKKWEIFSITNESIFSCPN